MEKAIGVLKARMKEYKEIGSDMAMQYYYSCQKAVNALEHHNELCEAVKSFVSDFESDFVMSDGTIVDNPSKLLMVNYKISKNALKAMS